MLEPQERATLVNQAITGRSSSIDFVIVAYGCQDRLLRRLADLVGVVMRSFREFFAAESVTAEHLVDIPNFAQVPRITSSAVDARRRLGWQEAPLTVVYAGTMGMKQGLGAVVGVAKVSHEENACVQFVLVGDRNRRAALESVVVGLPTIRFVGPLPAGDYPYVLVVAAVLLLTERPGVREKSMSRTLTSYSSSDRPLVASVAGDRARRLFLAARAAAVLVRQGNSRALLTGAMQIARDFEASATAAGSVSGRYADEYSVEVAARCSVSVAERLVGGR